MQRATASLSLKLARKGAWASQQRRRLSSSWGHNGDGRGGVGDGTGGRSHDNRSDGCANESSERRSSFGKGTSYARLKEFKDLAKRLRSCAKQGDIAGTMTILRVIDERGFERNDRIVLHLMEAMGANKRWRDALSIFNGIERPTEYQFSYILALLGRMGRVEEALGIYHRAKRLRTPMSVVMYNSLLLGFAKTADDASAGKILQQMAEDGVKPTESTYNTMINLYARKKDPKGARRIFDRMMAEHVSITTVTFNALLYAFVNAGELNEALELFELMVDHKSPAAGAAADDISRREAIVDAIVQSKHIRPTVQTFSTMITAFARAQQLDDAVSLFTRLKLTGIPLNVVVYNALIDAHVRTKKLEEASYLLGEMRVQGIKATTHSYTTVMFGFAKARDHKVVEELFEEMRRYGVPMNAVPYNALALAYIFAEEYQSAREVLVTMAVDPDPFTLGLRKSAGLEGESEQIIALADANLHEQVVHLFESASNSGTVLSERAATYAARSLIILQDVKDEADDNLTDKGKQKSD
mmetsp:Transcript_8202/g.24687  ORF Transcript_8202/g.24687 Transcript_8202/m.24687 type:complete len:528 (+) Transcript_8202:111-1694(+)|eukprot:CAMPEP_0198730664 /NCGR_PEP_ID=MMETSP1475-20131203/25523_1 /TAXON_ID= ORGANISM="Unidentified sp., Strain CCMP1999" /NCGR_SAMPLE_ID=MMETSP1475 /ASSEMBLY_ACC=CAM_ASM_001111 /LENGTH=527 /DNA_ID=CAMNT_0044493499 /DNA_START=51 /DNA_END=1634 /DNA_ORIENTATION=-